MWRGGGRRGARRQTGPHVQTFRAGSIEIVSSGVSSPAGPQVSGGVGQAVYGLWSAVYGSVRTGLIWRRLIWIQSTF